MCREVAHESLLSTNKLWRLVVLWDLRELTDYRQPELAKSVKGHQGNSSWYLRQHSRTFPCWLLNHLCLEIIVSALQTPSELLVPCCVVPPADIGVVQFPPEYLGLQVWGFLRMSEESLIYFLVRPSAAYTHDNIAHAGLLSKCSTGSSPIPR